MSHVSVDDELSILSGPMHDDLSVADSLNDDVNEVDRLNYIDEESAEKEYVTHSKLYLDAMKSVEQLQARLVRRSGIIAEMRKHYLRDIVAVRNIMNEVITSDERQVVLRTYTQSLPSLDMTQPLALYGPHNCDMDVKPCAECGGYVEIIVKDSEEMERLNKVLITTSCTLIKNITNNIICNTSSNIIIITLIWIIIIISLLSSFSSSSYYYYHHHIIIIIIIISLLSSSSSLGAI